MKYAYTATFIPTEDGSEFYCRVPDLPGCITTGSDIYDAIDMITDAASGWLVIAEDDGLDIPAATPQSELEIPQKAVLSIIHVDTVAYRNEADPGFVNKVVSLPAWMADLADKKGIDCSRILQDGLKTALSV